MKISIHQAFFTLLLAFTVGCSEQKENQPTTKDDEGHLFEAQQRALNKAEAVDGILQKSTNKTKKTIEESTQ